ncbi:MAG: glycosyltransferase family 2 protein [Flavobacteriales bacterium]|nr:glycosyltransferase family 2 protein [Flavobacteriales bacterium]
MKVSVVIPVYNKAPFLKECFDSVFGQTFSDFELIAVDDRSTDGSLAGLRRHAGSTPAVIELERNLGPAGCAQRGFDAATGEYIVRMDADDVMFPERIAKQVAFMDANPHWARAGRRWNFTMNWVFSASLRSPMVIAAPHRSSISPSINLRPSIVVTCSCTTD